VIRPDELVIDSFAGGGGASTGITAALRRPIRHRHAQAATSHSRHGEGAGMTQKQRRNAIKAAAEALSDLRKLPKQ
jgi:hypothetical protein